MCLYIYIYIIYIYNIYIYINTYVYMYIYRERERKRESLRRSTNYSLKRIAQYKSVIILWEEDDAK